MEHNGAFYLVDALDGVTLLVSLRITAADEHHADCRTLVELDAALVEIAFSHTFEEVYDVALQTEHHTLGLWIAHTAVVLDDHGFALYIDQTEEDETLVVDVLLGKPLYGRTDDTLVNLLHPLLGGKRYRCDASHTACVEACVVLTDTLVVFGFGQDLVVLAVGKYKYRALDAAEELLDDHTGRGVAEHTAEHLTELFLGLLKGRKDEDTLAGTESVSLQYVRSLQGLEKFQAVLDGGAVEGLVFGCRDVVALHELLGEILASLKHGTSL